MIRCNRCQTQNPDEAKFCFKCGTALPSPVAPGATVIQPPNSTQRTLIFGLLATALLVAGLAIGASGLFQSWSKAPPSGVTAKRADAPPPSLLEIRKDAPSGVLQRGQKGMPLEIREWLEHLERTEKQRRDLSLRQIGSFMATMATLQVAGIQDVLGDLMGDASEIEGDQKPSSADKVHGEVEEARTAWRNLREQFEAKPPPTECVPIRAKYEVALRETSGMMMDLMNALDRAMSSSDPEEMKQVVSELTAMKGKSAPIDQAGGETDALVAEICRKYETPKWFSIARDIGGGGMMGL
ncbi:MAG: zinc ribbon domain-containing protein [Chthonomonas sp.]|nr:zinc ribbon domain-containing protein [Chthonomonas sp.]